jgi:hypothetical protein
MGELRRYRAAVSMAAEVSNRILEGGEDSVLQTCWGASCSIVEFRRLNSTVGEFPSSGRVRSWSKAHYATTPRTYEGSCGARGQGD